MNQEEKNETNYETSKRDTQADQTTWAEQAAASFAGGNGSESAPYLISNGAQFAFMAKVFNDGSGQNISAYNRKFYKLTGNIDLGNIEWIPIGDSPFGRKANTCFYFDGGNHTVYGLMISKPEESFCGLFGFVDGDSVIKNLNIEGGSVTGFQNVGGIVGRMRGSIESCTFSGQVTGKQAVGGLVGNMSGGSLCNCVNGGKVTCERYGGGLAGSLTGYIQNCSNKGNIAGVEYIGGIAGSAKLEGFIESGENEGCVTGTYFVGGMIGHASSLFSLTLCINRNNISGDTYVGGIAGKAPLLRFCNNEGLISGSQIVGGVGGTIREVDTCQNIGYVSGSGTNVGGIVGICLSITDSSNLADISGNGPMGGVVGRFKGELINNCYNAGNISGTGMLGGIVGVTTQNNYEIKNSVNLGKVSKTWGSGPILGWHDGEYKQNARIEDSYYVKGCVENNG